MTEAEQRASFGYLWSLTLENVRCFGPAQTLELHDDGKLAKWTVILGDNGVGKTTLLQCLVAMAPAIGVQSGSIARATEWFSWPGPGSRSVYATLSRRGADPSMRVRLTQDAAIADLAEPSLEFEAKWDRDGGDGGVAYPNLSLHLFSCAYGASRKPATNAVSDDRDDETGTATTLFDERATLLGAEEWFLQSDYAAASTKSATAIARSEKIRETLVDLLPDVDELRVVGLDQQPPRPALEALTPYGWVRLRDLSLGYRTLMAWVIDFAARMFARYPKSEDPLAEPAVCLVDEIDLHLHPTWQRELIAFLDKRFPNTQFIVTAHSPLVVQAAEHANIAVLRRHAGDDFVTIHNDLDAVRGWRVDQILTSDLFGLEGSHAPRVNDRLQERATLLRKPQPLSRVSDVQPAEQAEPVSARGSGDTRTLA